ncbi:hypothetical protein [Streptomyces sp. NPDC097981]|uniref:hypothetical protein n=1 Tax=Streptomyces sp. NPDC097981 TaxID=3155428 RepID=UPI0033274364
MSVGAVGAGGARRGPGTRHGSYFDHSHLILRGGSPGLWADTIIWFLGLLPAGTPTVTMVETGPDSISVPPGAGRQEIQELLDTLLNADYSG